MRVRVLALFAGIVVLASCVAAKKKEKQVLPNTVLRAQTVFVVIQPDAREPLTEPNANLKAQKAVEEALMKWGKFRLALDTTAADIVISVQKGTGEVMSPTISGGPVDSRPGDVEGDAGQIRIMGQKGHPPDTTSIPTNEPSAPVHTGTQTGGSEDVLRLFIAGGVQNPLDYPSVWSYSRKDALKGPEVAAVAELKKVFEESEKVAADREKQKQQQQQAKNAH